MAAADKLWFELGVRDEISSVLEKLMRNSEKLANALSDDTAELKNVYKNIVDISNVYDKIYVAQKRISALKGASITPEQKKGLKDMSKDLEDVRKQFAAVFKAPDRLLNKGEAQFDKMRLNVELMVKDVLRYVDNIEAKERAEAMNAANETKRVDDLKAKYYELQRYRKQLSDAIAGAAPGTDLTDATSLINSISGRMSAVSRAQSSGRGLPVSTTGADYEEFLRKVKAELNGLSSATNDYNTKLEQNRQLQSTLQKLGEDAYSQQKIAGIRKQTAEYSALERKMRELAQLQVAIETEGLGLKNGTIKTPTYTKDKVTEELNAIQRRYNEALAAGKQREIEDAAAKNQKTASTRKAMEAVSALAHVNDNLISSYNRVAEAGSQANRITVQFQNQIGAYAGLYGLERILKSIVTIGGQFEVQHVALQNILGDVQQANILFGQLKELAIESPKTFMELTSYAKQLSAYQIPANELYDTTKRLADMSSGLGVDMNRLILAYGQVRSAAVLRGQELRQFTEAGIPMVQALADKFTQLNGKLTTTADVFKLISARAVPFEMVKEVLWDMTSQGGQFYNMQEELANTLYGKWQKLQDSWQIMLGSIAEGTNTSGYMFKTLLDIVVALTQNLDKMVPLLSALGAAKGISALSEGLRNVYMRRTGDMAIKNMEIAKLKEANRLERERIWSGRQLSAAELELVRNKNKLVSSDYQILALENQISAKKAHQLMLDGQMSKQHFYRYLQMQGYTREQRKQIALGNLQALQQGPNPTQLGRMGSLLGVGAKGALSFFGGWIGVAITAVGALTSLYEYLDQADDRLNDLANSISGGAEQNANQLANTLRSVENSTDEPYKKVEALEEALLGMGVAGKQVVQDSRGFDDMSERLKNLTENAKAYQEALEAMGTPQGKAAIKEALDKSDINDEMEEYEDLQNIEYKRMAALERYSAKYQQMIDSMKSKHKELEEQLTSTNLYENIRKLMTGEYANEAVGYFASNTPWGEAITDYAKAVEESEAHLNNIKDKVIPDAMDMLKSLARQAGVDINKSYEELTEAEKTKLRTIATNFANGLEKGSQDAKDSIASWVAQGFYAQLYLTPILNTSDLTGLPYLLDEWQKGKGYGLWSKNDLKEANTDFLAFSKKQSQRKVDLEKKIKSYDTQLAGSILDPDLVPTIKGQRTALQNELDQLNDSLKEGQWVFDKTLTKGSTSGGNKKDAQLEALKNRIDLYKKFYQELQGYKNIYTESEALDILKKDGEFGKVFDMKDAYGIKNLADYKGSLDALTAGFDANTEARQKLINTTKADIENKQRKEATEGIKVYVSELQKMMSVMSENYQTYKKWIELTGDGNLAARVAGVAQNTTYTDYLRGQMQAELNKNQKFSALTPDDIFGLSEKDIQKFGKESAIFAIWEEWRKNQRLLKKEQLELYADAIKNAKTYEDKIDDINRQLEKEIEAIEAMGGGENLIINARRNAEKKISSIQWDKFKEENNWGEVFGDLGSMPLNRLKKMITAMQEFAQTAHLDVTETKAWYEAMEKLTNQEAVLDPIQAIATAIKNYDLSGKKIGELEMRRESIRRGYDTSMTEDELEKAIEDLKITQTKALRDLQKAIKALSSNITSLGNSFETLGNSIGGSFGDVLNGFGTIFGGLGKSMDAISNVDINAEGIAAVAGEVGAVVSVFSAMVDMNKKLHELLPSTESLYEYYAEKQREINKAREAIDDYAVAVIKSAQKERDWLYKNELTEIRNGGYVQTNLLENYAKTALAPQVIYEESRSGLSKWAGAIIGAIVGAVITIVTWGSGGPLGVAAGTAIANIIGGVAATAVGAAVATGAGAAIGQAMQAAAESILYKEGETSARANMRIQHHHASFWRGEKTQNLEEWVREEYGKELFGWDFHGYNLIDLDIAKSVLERDISLAGETRETLERLVEITEQIKEIQDQAHQYVSDRFSPLVDNMTNSLWDWLKDGTNMLRSFRDYASDTFTEIAQDAIKAFLKINLMDKFTTPLNDMFEAYSFGLIDETALMLGVANVAGQIGETFATLTPTLQEMGKVLADAFKLEGYDIVNGSQGSGSSSTNTVKGMSEGTADVIVGYINAIRADVSVNRTMIANYYPQFLSSMQRGNTIADSQLAQLRTIVENTRQNREFVERIYNILHGVAPDGMRIQVK